MMTCPVCGAHTSFTEHYRDTQGFLEIRLNCDICGEETDDQELGRNLSSMEIRETLSCEDPG